ncbi:MAG: hypothetical protein KKD31_15205 [Bacteroidetes bacterium]|nr:hypothetical protein [Bacteroidota bacterium]
MKKTASILIIAAVSAFTFGCKAQQTATYIYADGSGNSYSISADSIIYDPITPAESSSGYYSGGEPFAEKLDEIEFQYISAMLDKAMGAKDEQTDTRVMGTGLIVRTKNKKEQEVFLKEDSRMKAKIEAWLSGFK